MRSLLVLIGIGILVITPTCAEDFSVNSTELGKLLVNNTVEQFRIYQRIFLIFELADDEIENLYQNLWGVFYGFMVLGSINNCVTNNMLNAILDERYTVDMSTYGYSSSEKLYDVVGYSIEMLGSNATEVFGDPEGNRGLAVIQGAKYKVLANSEEFDHDYLKAYATELVKTLYTGTMFFIKIMSAVDEAFTAD